ncbi:hypothetical protein [Piscinibacter sp.]|uniref:hypothetical protein n=1 Tax=Piscinibacter sp. TaxID=1903157 RepID=UPI002D049F27|nr:hypothetical protein [Albitalea sp.]HUG24715.1 hypothetical protein [Albitalea sp.]
MSVDYFAEYPCSVRAAVSDGELFRIETARRVADDAMAAMRGNPERHGWVAAQAIKITKSRGAVLGGLPGPPSEAVCVDDLSRYCRGCRANPHGTAFGCGGTIQFPFTQAAERWMLSRLPDDLGGPAGKLLVRVMGQQRFDGASIEFARERPEIFESSVAAERTWRRFPLRRFTVSSSRIIHMMLGSGDLQPHQSRLVAYLLGYSNEKAEPLARTENAPGASDDVTITELKHFLRAAAFAAASRVTLLVDA